LPKEGNDDGQYTEIHQNNTMTVSAGTKKDKGKIFQAFTKVTGNHRKAAIRLLHQANKVSTMKKRGRPRQ